LPGAHVAFNAANAHGGQAFNKRIKRMEVGAELYVKQQIAEVDTAHRDSHTIEAQVEALLRQLTLEEKINYINSAPPENPNLLNSTGQNIRSVPRLGLPELRDADGPVGIRVTTAQPSTRYPANLLLAATWNPERAEDEGTGIGRNARARGFHIWLGQVANMYRVPVGGRNAEYLCGEDPVLGSRMVVPMVRAAQAQGVVATIKHFLTNDQEYDRFKINSAVDERTLREIYFPPFEAAVRHGHVGAVMLAYPRLNGVFCTQNPFLMQTVLAEEWGFKGMKVSEFSGVRDGPAAAQAGLDIDFALPITPRNGLMSAKLLEPALRSNQLKLATLDDKVRRILRTILEYRFQSRSQFDPSGGTERVSRRHYFAEE
jgi:beta-glucosidase